MADLYNKKKTANKSWFFSLKIGEKKLLSYFISKILKIIIIK